MANAKQKLKELAKSPEGLAAGKMLARIEQKLNFDGRYSALNPAESMLRFGRLSNEESEYLGRFMGWDEEFHGGIDWANVSTPLLSECVMLNGGRAINVLSYVHPSPSRIPVFDAAEKSESGDIEAYLSGDLTFDELAERYPTVGVTMPTDGKESGR